MADGSWAGGELIWTLEPLQRPGKAGLAVAGMNPV